VWAALTPRLQSQTTNGLVTGARFLLAVTDYKQGNYAVAAEELRAAIGAGVVDSDLHYLLAECMLMLDAAKTADAKAELDRAIALRSDSVSARGLRSKLLLEEEQPKAAVVDLDLAHKVDPGSRSATYNLARAYFALGRTEDAMGLYKELHTQSVDVVRELSDHRAKEALAGSSPDGGH
jgi:tetratricopeptide (TPR) repeat protein